MLKIYVHDDHLAHLLFTYESEILPMVGDVYANPDNSGNHYQITKRLLHANKEMNNVISVWVKKTN